MKRLGERLAMWWAGVAGAMGAVAVRIKRRASSVLGKEEPPQDDGRLADILLLLRNDEVVGTAALGPVIVPSHMPDAAAPSSLPTSPTAGAAPPSSPPAGGSSGSSSSGMGGNESCAHALSVLMMVLAHYPKYQDLIYDEVRTCVGRSCLLAGLCDSPPQTPTQRKACRVLGRGKKTASLLLLSSQGQLTGLQDVQRLPYARGVMNEVFRLYPPDKV